MVSIIFHRGLSMTLRDVRFDFNNIPAENQASILKDYLTVFKQNKPILPNGEVLDDISGFEIVDFQLKEKTTDVFKGSVEEDISEYTKQDFWASIKTYNGKLVKMGSFVINFGDVNKLVPEIEKRLPGVKYKVDISKFEAAMSTPLEYKKGKQTQSLVVFPLEIFKGGINHYAITLEDGMKISSEIEELRANMNNVIYISLDDLVGELNLIATIQTKQGHVPSGYQHPNDNPKKSNK
jgi:hypothetical protein